MAIKQTLQNIFFGYQYNSSINSSREEIKSMFPGILPFQEGRQIKGHR